MSLVWTEEMIRDELRRLDRKIGLGLRSASLRIEFNNSKKYMGMFCVNKDKNDCYFKFSNYYMKDTDFPDTEKLDIIRHEFAHYYDFEIYHSISHNATWKFCCSQAGALPSRLCSKDRVNYLKKEEAANIKLNDKAAHLIPGQLLLHPQYELGTILAVCGKTPNIYLDVEFDQAVKRISLRWALENCDFD